MSFYPECLAKSVCLYSSGKKRSKHQAKQRRIYLVHRFHIRCDWRGSRPAVWWGGLRFKSWLGNMLHLDSWVKRDQLDVTCFNISLFNVQHVSDVNTSILRSLRIICWAISRLYCSGSMCVGVTLWFGCGGVVSVCRLKPAYGYHTAIATLQRNTNTHRTRSIQPMK